MIEIPIVNSKQVALIDDSDYAQVSQYIWYASGNRLTTSKGVLMHQLIIGKKPGKITDHKDRNGFNNQRVNLRFVDKSQNRANSCKKVRNGSSKYKGVWKSVEHYKDSTYIHWVAEITYLYKKHYLGRYKTENEAAIAYNKAATQYFGEFANLNLIEENILV